MSRRRIIAVGVIALVMLAGAGSISASRGLPDLDLAGDASHGAPPRRAALRHPAGVTVTAIPTGIKAGIEEGPVVGRAPLPLPDPPLPYGVTPTTSSITIGTMVRTYDVFSPPAGTGSVPALVVLHGRKTSLTLEESRDGLVELAHQGKATVVYPAGYGESWNAGACCGPAQVAGVDDLSFLTDLIRSLGSQPNVSAVYLVGYSNGGRMAYDVVCAHPKLVSSFVVVAAVPVVACAPGAPVSLLEMVGSVDPLIAYDAKAPHQHINGYPEPTVTDVVALWRKRDGCSIASSKQTTGTFQLQTWSHCQAGSVVGFGTYAGAGHAWPGGGHGAPSGADVLWRFLTAPRATTPVPEATPLPESTTHVLTYPPGAK